MNILVICNLESIKKGGLINEIGDQMKNEKSQEKTPNICKTRWPHDLIKQFNATLTTNNRIQHIVVWY